MTSESLDFTAQLYRVKQGAAQSVPCLRYRLNRFSVERLMQFLTQLGKDVEIRIATRPARRPRMGVRVSHVA